MLLPMCLHLCGQCGDISRVLMKIADDGQTGDMALLGTPRGSAVKYAGCSGARILWVHGQNDDALRTIGLRLAQYSGQGRLAIAHGGIDLGLIAALAAQVQAHWQQHGRAQKLLLSFHGLPQRCVDLGDPYAAQCQQTAALLAAALQLPPDAWQISFQSRFGKAKWLEPATDRSLVALATQGGASVEVFCPGFVADCLETLEEIAIENRDIFIQAGGQDLRFIPCLNDSPAWLDALAQIADEVL